MKKSPLDTTSAKVMILKCPTYHQENLAKKISLALDEFELKPKGKVLVKPDLGFAHYDYLSFGQDSFTNTEVVEGTIKAAADSGETTTFTIGTKSGVGYPSRVLMNWAQYSNLASNLKVEGFEKEVSLLGFENDRTEDLFLGGKVHAWASMPSKLATFNFNIWLPKLRKHATLGIAGAIHSYLGFLNNDMRAIHHDYLLPNKLADFYGVIKPDLIVMDAIVAGLGHELAPYPYEMGLVIIGTDPFAVDVVAARLMGFSKPTELPYLKEISARGKAPFDPFEVNLCGDYTTWEQIDAIGKQTAKEKNYSRWHNIEEELTKAGSEIKLLYGPYSDLGEQKCQHGCYHQLAFALSLLERTKFNNLKNARPVQILIGRHEQPVDCNGNVAIKLGKCCRAKVINARKVCQIPLCFATVIDIIFKLCWHTRLPNPILKARFFGSVVAHFLFSLMIKTVRFIYFKEILIFIRERLFKKV